MDYKQTLGLHAPGQPVDLVGERRRLVRYINLQLIASGLPSALDEQDFEFTEVAKGLLDNYHEKSRLLEGHRAPVDARIEAFLNDHFRDLELDEPLRLPSQTLVLDQHGVARTLSLPADGDTFRSELLSSYRAKNGVLHNPLSDRRTTKGTFHVAEGGLTIPADKKRVPRATFVALFRRALQPPPELTVLPFTANRPEPARTFVSLLIRPIVCPAVPGVCSEKRMEVRFFAPGTLVSNLDFVESIFGNAGDPFIPRNDAGLDVEHWTGHTGAVILAPHLVRLTKKEVGLPHFDDATPAQRRDGMCWRTEDELYNDGTPFKLTCRTEAGVIVTLIADNYFGYCKKEVKTQISYAANLYGNVEEEHAGGTLAFPSYNLGEEFLANSQRYNGRTFDDVARDYADTIDVQPAGYGVDKRYPDLVYIPENARATLAHQRIVWTRAAQEQSIPLLPGKVYMTPSGYKLRMEKHPEAPTWRLIGTVGEGTFCHKPCTVSGGGKSEISKSLVDYMLYGPIFVADLEEDLNYVEEIFHKDYSTRWRSERRPDYSEQSARSILDPQRTLGSVIKLLTPSEDYTDEYNAWLASIPNYVYAIVYVIKRFQKPEWNGNWRDHFSVDIVNGFPGHELKYDERKLVGSYLRVGLLGPQVWRTYKLRQDFAAAAKVQTEDDISASVVVPASQLAHLDPHHQAPSYKFVTNCESRLFQRPDDAIHRGLDKQAESDLAQENNFISNFEPLSRDALREMFTYVVDLDKFTEPMQRLLRSALDDHSSYVVCSSVPRLIDGKPSKNPRYLQTRPDLVRPMDAYVAEQGTRLFRAIPADKPVPMPVGAVLFGRRNNPPDSEQGIRSLAVYSPIHYQELPELFMDFICSLTGKSPSTTAAGSEGALTKGPFNALRPTADLNTALVSYILTDLAGFSTAAGHIGPKINVGHDISLLIPEIWCRLTPEERDPRLMIEAGLLERLEDFQHQGETILASRLGYRITYQFVRRYFGRVFDNPNKVFDQTLLKPETQDLDSFADGIKYITEAHQRVARQYFDDGSIEDACPPLRALLHIMAHGSYEGKDVRHPEVRSLFTREYLLESDWYAARLEAKQQRDTALWKRHVAYLEEFLAQPSHQDVAERLAIPARLELARNELDRVRAASYRKTLRGALGASTV